MEPSTKQKILDSIGKIYESASDCKLQDSYFTIIDTELTFLAGYFRTTKSQAFFIAIFFALSYPGTYLEFNDLIKHLGCNPMKILEYTEDMEVLQSLGILDSEKSTSIVSGRINEMITINEKIVEAILKNQPMPQLKGLAIDDVFDMLDKIDKLQLNRESHGITTCALFEKAEELISKCMHFPLIKKINSLDLIIEDTFLFLYIINRTLSGLESVYLSYFLERVFDGLARRVNYSQGLVSGENGLIKSNIIEIVEARFFADTEVKLTSFSRNLLKESGLDLFVSKTKKGNTIKPSEIPFRKLIFGKSEMSQLFLLKDLLEDTKFRETQKRLSEKNLPKGVTALLYGAPGTGKTEIVKQMAKESNRMLVNVDISQSKSMWFGESEKIVKRIFTSYKTIASECDLAPILLFNEADAIFSKRKDVERSNVAQTENSIQNIILEELENFEGILIATTNLAENLDSAFERRFLFKVHFHKPSVIIRAQIWKSKLPLLNDEECNILAREYDFSGGQIDNVLRKNEIHEIIHGEKVTLSTLLAFCGEEHLANSRVKIGFSKQ
jgi:Cdc6-like AAA superfamily ATPase